MSNLPYVLEGRYVQGDPLDMEDARKASRAFAEMRRSARRSLEEAVEAHMEAQREWRKARALAYVSTTETSQDRRKADVESRTADLEYVAGVKKGLVDSAQERLKEIDGERASFHRLVEWSTRLDAFAQEQRSQPQATTFGGGR